VRFSEGGERFAAVGQGGMAAAWRLDAPTFTRSDSGPLARSDWCHQVRLSATSIPAAHQQIYTIKGLMACVLHVQSQMKDHQLVP
jgi:hypothetical protein